MATGRPDAVLAGLGCTPARGWPAGVYFSPRLLHVGFVVARELPRERSTLLVRLMAGGPLLPQAIEALSRLPSHAHERAVAERILLNLKHVLGQKPRRTREEQEFIVTMQSTWEQARDEGRAVEAAEAILTVLRVRGIRVPKAARERILAQKDPARLKRWLEKAVHARSAAELLQEPS